MVDARIRGRSLTKIAEEFGVSVDTVKRSLTRAEKFDLAARYEDYLVGRLGALAIGAYESALLDGDTAVATKVLESIGLIRKPAERPTAEGGTDEVSWEAYLKVRKKKREDDDDSSGDEIEAPQSRGRGTPNVASPEAETFDGEVVGTSDLPAEPSGQDEPGDSE